MSAKKPTVFISYSSKDRPYADRIRAELALNDIGIWIDRDEISFGDRISDSIIEGMTAADYYLLLISENSNNSAWVQREISQAFDLAQKKDIAVIPFLLEKVEVPLEFKGLLYVDGTASFERGIASLLNFFRRQNIELENIEPELGMTVGRPFDPSDRSKCRSVLGLLKVGQLRFSLATKLTLKDIRILFYDVFQIKIEDEVFSLDKASWCLELVDRSERENVIKELIDTICRNHPKFSSSLPTV